MNNILCIVFNNIYNKTVKVFTFTVLLFLTVACIQNNPEEIKAIGDMRNVPSLNFEDFTVFLSDSGKLFYRISTPKMLKFDKVDNPYIEYPKGGQVEIFDSLGNVSSSIKCKYAIYHNKKMLWNLYKDVEAVNEDGVKFNTNQIFWDSHERIIYTKPDQFVKITTKTEITTGYGLSATQNFKKYSLKNMSGEFEIKKEDNKSLINNSQTTTNLTKQQRDKTENSYIDTDSVINNK